MARPTDENLPRTVLLTFRVTEDEAARIEDQRGNLSKSDYIRTLIRRDRQGKATR